MKTRLIRIGNSRGVRLPKAIIAEAQLSEEVELNVRNGTVIISRTASARSGYRSIKECYGTRKYFTS